MGEEDNDSRNAPQSERPMTSSPCPFCSPDPDRVFFQGRRSSPSGMPIPVNPGHALIVPNRHVASWFDATAEEQAELFHAVSAVREEIEASHHRTATTSASTTALRPVRRWVTSTCT